MRTCVFKGLNWCRVHQKSPSAKKVFKLDTRQSPAAGSSLVHVSSYLQLMFPAFPLQINFTSGFDPQQTKSVSTKKKISQGFSDGRIKSSTHPQKESRSVTNQTTFLSKGIFGVFVTCGRLDKADFPLSALGRVIHKRWEKPCFKRNHSSVPSLKWFQKISTFS